MKKFVALAVALAAALTLGVTVAVAAPAEHLEWPVEFTLTGGDPADAMPAVCNQLEDDLVVEGTGSAHLILHGNGFTLVINGTAEDSDGGTYVFNYHAAGNFNPATSELIFSDHFHLVGNGAANQIKTFFVVKVAFSESGDPIIDAHPLRGDPLWDMNLVLEENEDNVRCDPV